MFRKSILILLGILLFGLVLRIYRIWEVPLYGDELTMVYDTYSISKTGMDATGEKFPLTFRMGAGRPGGYVYFSVPFVAAFGPGVWGVRSLSLLSGMGVIILLYFLGRKLFNERVGLVASLLAAVSPWEIFLSRAGFEAHLALFLALLGICAFLYRNYVLWGFSWGIAIHTYPTFKLTLPLLFVLLVWYLGFGKLVKNKIFVAGIIILLFFGGLAVRENLKSGSEQRFMSENIFAIQNIRESLVQRVNYERTVSTLPERLRPIFINRGIEYGRLVFESYAKNLSPDFLVLRGDRNPRHNPGEMGMIYLIELPLILAGLSLLWKERRKEFILLLKWILITPLATMLFPEAHALRNGLMLPALLLLCAFALIKIPKRYVYLASIMILIQLVYILTRVYTIAPEKFASFWSADAKTVALEAIDKSKAGEKVVLSTKEVGDIEYAYEVYAEIDPNQVISQYGTFPKVFGNITIIDK